MLYGTRLSSSEEDYQGTPRSSVPVRTVTRKQIEEFKTNAGSTVVVHPDDNVNCEIVAESQPGWTFDSWLVDDKQEFSLHSTLNRVRLGGHHSDLLIFAHFVPWSDDSDLGSVKPSG